MLIDRYAKAAKLINQSPVKYLKHFLLYFKGF